MTNDIVTLFVDTKMRGNVSEIFLNIKCIEITGMPPLKSWIFFIVQTNYQIPLVPVKFGA